MTSIGPITEVQGPLMDLVGILPLGLPSENFWMVLFRHLSYEGAKVG